MEVIAYWRNTHGILLTNSTSYGLGEGTNSWISMILQGKWFYMPSKETLFIALKVWKVSCEGESIHSEWKVSRNPLSLLWPAEGPLCQYLHLDLLEEKSKRRVQSIMWNIVLKKMLQAVLFLLFCRWYRSNIVVIIRKCLTILGSKGIFFSLWLTKYDYCTMHTLAYSFKQTSQKLSKSLS